eukprot:g3224.t1
MGPVEGVLSGLVCALSVVSALLFVMLRRVKHEKVNKENHLCQFVKKCSTLTKMLQKRELDIDLLGKSWRIEEDELQFDKKKISSNVWKAKLREQWTVAVKQLPGKGVTNQKNDPEIQFLMHTRHPRLVMFFGFCASRKYGMYIVMEFMQGGDLSGLLWNRKQTHVHWPARLQILKDVAEGLAYLHLVHKTIHRDIKSPNILLSTKSNAGIIRAKIADFGLSKMVFTGKKRYKPSPNKRTNPSSVDDKVMPSPEETRIAKNTLWTKRILGEGFVGTLRWMAPEIMQEDPLYSPGVDIYSFGLLMFEVAFLRRPWDGMDDKNIVDAVRKGDRPSFRQKEISECMNENFADTVSSCYVAIMKRCWDHNPRVRVPINTISNRVSDLMSVVCAGIQVALASCDEEAVVDGIIDVRCDGDSDEKNVDGSKVRSIELPPTSAPRTPAGAAEDYDRIGVPSRTRSKKDRRRRSSMKKQNVLLDSMGGKSTFMSTRPSTAAATRNLMWQERQLMESIRLLDNETADAPSKSTSTDES